MPDFNEYYSEVAMAGSWIPRIKLNSVFEIEPERLARRGIRLLLLDLDNTLSPYSGSEPSEALNAWRDGLRACGIEPFIVSNTKTQRAREFSARWGVGYIDRAKKPFGEGIGEALRRFGAEPREAALAGDQIFTDVWGANRNGLLSIVVRPMENSNVFRAARYVAELPIRAFAAEKKI